MEDQVGTLTTQRVPGELCMSMAGHVSTVLAIHGDWDPATINLVTVPTHFGRALALIERTSSWTLSANVSHSVRP